MWRVFGIPTPLSGALHTVASQHMTTLHNTSGTIHSLLLTCSGQVSPLRGALLRVELRVHHALIFQIACALRVIAIRARWLCNTELCRSIRNNVRWIFASSHATIEAMSTPSQRTIRRARVATYDDAIRCTRSRLTTATTSTSEEVGTAGRGPGPQRSTLVLGPSRSGKTSSLVIPNILLAQGPVVSTSTKPDVMDATATGTRARRVGLPLRSER